MKRVVVHIDRLVLKGFRHEDKHAVAAGLQQEMERVFGEREVVLHLTAVGDVSRLQLGGAQTEHGCRPERVGERVADGIGREMRK